MKTKRWHAGLENSTIHPLLQFLARFEERQLFRLDLDVLSGFGIPANVGFIVLHKKRTESSDLNPFPLCQ